jgi:FixJ family two-component response regulator
MNNLKPKISVVDDDPSLRKAIERLLRAAELDVSTYASAQDYLAQFDPAAPGCLLLDLAMPGLSGLDLQSALAHNDDAPPIIFLTGCATVPDSVRALKSGAIEFLTKPVDDVVLLTAISSAIERDRIDRSKRIELENIKKKLARLTPRESEVLVHVVSGKLNKQIAGELGTVEKTIKVHRGRIMEKMEVKSLAQLVMLAAAAGITPISAQ